ncbi:MAG TPA: NAD-dependent epimerase/dehydratase family protein [Candidatus Angelobacter sp.]|nr:NAD-dependent epimerase/dehydratase family protein [Candidatus Angelobacter sp.]
MRILITGGTGNLGSRLLVPLVQRGDQVVLFDLNPRPHVETAEFRRVVFVKGDLGNREDVLRSVRDHGIESIFHLGAVLSSVAEQQPALAWRANMDGICNVYEAARLSGVKRLIFSSTVATYGAGLPDPLPIDAPQWPVSLYGVTKVAGERLGVYYHHRFGIDFRAVRLPAVVAPHGAAGGVSAYCSMAFEESVLKGRYEFFINPTTRAPMLYIADAVRALLELHDLPEEKLRRRVYNLAGINPSAEEMAAAIQQRLPHVQITYRPDPSRVAILESWPHRIDDSEARRDWDWKATYDLARMTDEIIEALHHGPGKE